MATPTAPPATPSVRPPATASGSACSGPMPGAAWAPSSWRWTPSCIARWRSSRSSTTTPTTRSADSGFCWRPRSPAGWSTPGSSRSMAWALTPMAGRITPCGSSAAIRLKEAIDRFHAKEIVKTDPGRRSLELRQAAAAVPGCLQRDRLRPLAAASCTATSSRATSSSASTVRRWWSIGDWPRPPGGPNGVEASGERTLVPSSASGSSETLSGSALGTPAYMSPEQAQGDLERLGPHSDVYSLGATLYCLLTGKPPVEGDDVGAVLRQFRREGFHLPGSSTRRSTGAGGGLPQGDGPEARATATRRPGRWLTTSSGGWPTSR